MRKYIIGLVLLTLLATGVSAYGAGIITNMDFGEVQRGATYTKEMKFWAMDNRYKPYTDIPVPEDEKVWIKVENEDPFVDVTEGIIWHPNEYTQIPVTLNIPKNAQKGVYSSQLCGSVCPYNNNDEIGFCVGACTDIKYEITTGKPIPKYVRGRLSGRWVRSRLGIR